ELTESFVRASGPGGQNVNKVETKVLLRFDVRGSRCLNGWQRRRLLEALGPRLTKDGVLLVHADGQRERGRNLTEGLERLASILRAGLHRDPPRKATRPTRGSVKRRLQDKKKRGDIKKQRRRGSGDHD
ncbi:MAG: alternative ribosome rescue aminoacyl-tRNA hydrolase ArfB, partial [Myxococcota bacterium]